MRTWKLSAKEVKRVQVLTLVKNGSLTLSKAAELLELGYRQAKRVWKRFQKQGAGGLAHKSRGKPGNRRLAARLRKRVLTVVQKKYADYGPTLASECLAEEEKIQVHPETLRRWGMAAGQWKPRERKVYRTRRERRSCPGQMLQMDGSHHDWLEGRGPWCVLMVIIDDATNYTYARFYEGETMAAAMDCFWRYAKAHGIPHELYVDRDSIYRSDRLPTAAEALAGTGPLSQFGRAMKQLDVRATDPGGFSPGQGTRGTPSWGLSGSAGQGAQAEEDQKHPGGQRLFGQSVPQRAQRAVHRPGGRSDRRASPCAPESPTDLLPHRAAAGRPGLVRAL